MPLSKYNAYLNCLKGKELVLLENKDDGVHQGCLSIERLSNRQEVVLLHPEVRPVIRAHRRYRLERRKLALFRVPFVNDRIDFLVSA
ncbi:hypothetical protein DPMN_184557 [Dreissena polymorpha]|uniref:Uncharacterized protein n=1 Tax=Dreissena polymorpha TaxID=45954 RepID=A0A9D4I4Q9_DREPO|nr:hypothetical protein DPMN_184557 [Dreissena polymorpha]